MAGSAPEGRDSVAEALARRSGLATPDLTTVVHAAMINAALRVAVEHHVFQSGPTDDEARRVEAAVSEALLIAARGFSP